MPSISTRSVCVAAAGLALALAGCSSMTYGTGTSPGKQTFDDLTGLVNLGGKKRPPIDYEPRPPIVAPPATAALPPPEKGATVTATDWPRDPDAIAQARKDAQAKGGHIDPAVEALQDPGWRVAETHTPENRSIDHGEDSAITTLKEVTPQKQKEAEKMIAAAKSGAAGKVDANGNPIRTTLTEPPADYRAPDPNSPQEFKDSKKKHRWWWPFDN